MSKKGSYPPGWDEERVRRVLAHYEQRTDEEAVAEDGTAFESTTNTAMQIPVDLVPRVRELIASGLAPHDSGMELTALRAAADAGAVRVRFGSHGALMIDESCGGTHGPCR